MFWGGVMALKGPVERGQALNGYSRLENFSNYNGARVAIATKPPGPDRPCVCIIYEQIAYLMGINMMYYEE